MILMAADEEYQDVRGDDQMTEEIESLSLRERERERIEEAERTNTYRMRRVQATRRVNATAPPYEKLTSPCRQPNSTEG